MNAIISLCHFCEIHGPSVIFCTQAFHAPEPVGATGESEVFADNDFSYGQHKAKAVNIEGANHPLQVNNTQSKTVTLSAPSSPTKTLPDKVKVDSCEGCIPFTNGRSGFISHDLETGVSYISSHQPRNSEVYSIIRHACIRSLSCEVCPNPCGEGPLFFGDDHRSQVLSYTFQIKDSNARGQEHMFSIIVVMMDKIFLLNSWPFLVKHIQLIIDELKQNSNKTFEDETASRQQSRSCRSIASSQYSTVPRSASYRLQRGSGNKPTRSLTELTADKGVFERLHTAFSWLLKAGGDRLTERLLEGPPTEACCLVDTTRSEETEEGFVKVYSKVNTTVDVTMRRHVETDDVSLPATMTTLFTQLRNFTKLLGPKRFHVVGHHILIGNQVVVRSSCKLLALTILDCLKILLPKGCCRTEYYSDVYIPMYKCNFLGVSSSVEVPVDTALCVLIDVIDSRDSETLVTLPSGAEVVYDRRTPDEIAAVSLAMTTSSSGPHSLLVRVGNAEEIVDLNDVQYRVIHTPKNVISREPSLLSKVEKVLFNDSFADSVSERSLLCVKDDWLNKVKRFFMFTQLGESRSKEEMEKFNSVIGVQEYDKISLKFWMSGLGGIEYQLSSNCALPASSTTAGVIADVICGT